MKLSGVLSENDILGVVFGIFHDIDYEFDNLNRSLVLRRGVLAQLRTGTYTVSADLKSGGISTFNLTVTDSTPSGIHAYVAEYNTSCADRAELYTAAEQFDCEQCDGGSGMAQRRNWKLVRTIRPLPMP